MLKTTVAGQFRWLDRNHDLSDYMASFTMRARGDDTLPYFTLSAYPGPTDTSNPTAIPMIHMYLAIKGSGAIHIVRHQSADEVTFVDELDKQLNVYLTASRSCMTAEKGDTNESIKLRPYVMVNYTLKRPDTLGKMAFFDWMLADPSTRKEVERYFSEDGGFF